MKKRSKNKKISTIIFVIFSITNLFFLVFLFFLFKYHFYKNIYEFQLEEKNKNTCQEKSINNYDPLVTTIPQAKDLIKSPILNNSDPSIGSKDPIINIVYFSDFKCSYCFDQEVIFKNILNKYEDKVRLIWKDYPENNFDTQSYQASIAARCASKQGAFWQYHDILYQSDSLDKKLFLQIAQKLNLDIDQFERCLESKNIITSIENNIYEAQILGIRGVPYIYVDNIEFMGEVSEDEIEKIIKFNLENPKD